MVAEAQVPDELSRTGGSVVLSWRQAALVGIAIGIALASPRAGGGATPAAETVRVAVFGDFNLPSARFPEMWRAFDATVGRPLRRAGIPLGFALGNHDASAARAAGGGYLFARERDFAAAYWRDPAHRPVLQYVDARNFPFSYSFVLGGVFFVAVDASTHVIQATGRSSASTCLKTARARAAEPPSRPLGRPVL
jgi:hypothetical protein